MTEELTTKQVALIFSIFSFAQENHIYAIQLVQPATRVKLYDVLRKRYSPSDVKRLLLRDEGAPPEDLPYSPD